MSNRIIPSINQAIGAGIDSIVSVRPNTLKHINNGAGRYADLFLGWMAQGQLVIRRFADEAKSLRLISSGIPLQQLSRSEFSVDVSSDPTFSIGEVYLTRSVGPLPAGVIRASQQWFKQADPDAQPLAIPGSVYQNTQDVVVATGQTNVTVPIKAVTAGASGNIPQGQPISLSITPNTQIKPSSSLFDTNFAVVNSTAAGGTNTPNSDFVLRRLSTASYVGRNGPTDGAIIAGALSYPGISHLAVIENTSNARSVIFAVDESWGYSPSLSNAVGQGVKDKWQGFGCAIQLGQTGNTFVHIDATVQLADTDFLVDTNTISNDITTALNAYFSDRFDWWTWKTSAIQATIASANRRIFACTSVTVKDAVTSSVLAEPGPLTLDDNIPILNHWFLPDNAINLTFTSPP